MSTNHDPAAVALHEKMKDRGNWFQTASGRAFYPLHPDESEVFIGDIAHALSLICRFGGHCRDFYSVAQHSLYVSQQLAPWKELEVLKAATSGMGREAYRDLVDLGLAGLLHDSPEAYIGDMVSPLKHTPELAQFRNIDEQLERCIFQRFSLDHRFRPSAYGSSPGALIKPVDRRILFTEKRDLREHANVPPSLKWEDAEKYPPFEDLVIRAQSPEAAREAFLERFSDLWLRKTNSAWSLG